MSFTTNRFVKGKTDANTGLYNHFNMGVIKFYKLDFARFVNTVIGTSSLYKFTALFVTLES